MCGLAGFFRPGGWRGGSAVALAQAMAQRIAYRGPDDAGAWADEEAGIALAHRRLSILDVSPAGHQPMTSACGRYVLVFNGEIYNHQVWRSELGLWPSQAQINALAPTADAGLGGWRGHSDTETLLAGIQAWGLEEALRRAQGMFALALWDRASGALTLARDRVGEKPLYFGWQGGTLLFGSELKALRAHPAFQASVDRQALALLMRHGAIPAPHSIYEGVNKLLPGCWMTVSARDPRAPPRRYWDLGEVLADGALRPFAGTPQDAVSVLDRLLGDSVAQQMVADVPLGAFLSGGVDSSTIVSLMQARSAQPVRTFTVGFDDRDHDEADHARAVAQHLGTAHTEVRLLPRQALDLIPQLPSLYCEPLADPSQIPTVLVSRLARTQVSVSLSGDAGDELFAGYGRYRAARALWRPWARLSPRARAVSARAVRRFRPGAWGAGVPMWPAGLQPAARALAAAGDRLDKAAGVFESADAQQFYQRLMSQWTDPQALVLGLPGADDGGALDAHDGWEEPASPVQARAWSGLGPVQDADGFVHQMMADDLLAYLPDHVLAKVDRAAMSCGLETRVPMLGSQVVAFAWRLPLDLKWRHGVSKWVLRQVLSRYVPHRLFDRPKKGFGVPLGSWLRGPLRPWAEPLLAPERLAREGYLAPALVRRKWDEHLTGQHDWGFQLWNVLTFQAWLEQVQQEGDPGGAPRSLARA